MMIALRKNWMTTLGGILAGLGTLPLLVTASHMAFPLWWNNVQFPLFLCGAVGTIIMGLAAKGQDEHSTIPQTEAATVKAVADKIVTATTTTPTEMPAVPVVIVNPPERKVGE